MNLNSKLSIAVVQGPNDDVAILLTGRCGPLRAITSGDQIGFGATPKFNGLCSPASRLNIKAGSRHIKGCILANDNSVFTSMVLFKQDVPLLGTIKGHSSILINNK